MKRALIRTHTDEVECSAARDAESIFPETPYMKMLREESQMYVAFNIAISVANWALLAGYLVIPGTFTSLQASDQVEKTLESNKAGRTVLHTVQNPPLLAISCCFFVAGIATIIWLLRVPILRRNYIWLINKLFAPVSLNSVTELLSTLLNVYTSKGGDWSLMAIVTTVVTGVTLLIASLLLLVYKFYKLERLKREDWLVRHTFIPLR